MAKINKNNTMMKSNDVKYLQLFETNKNLINLIENRTMLNKMRSQVHKDIYNNTTEITKIEESLKKIVLDLEKIIPK